jgi:hypothetical protein
LGIGDLLYKEIEIKATASQTGRDGQLTKREFYLGFMLSAFEDQQGQTPSTAAPAGAQPTQPADTPRRTPQGKFGPADRVELYVEGTWYPATVLSARDGSYRLARDDRSFGVASSDEWVSENRLRPYVAKPTPSRAPAGRLASVIPPARGWQPELGVLQARGRLADPDPYPIVEREPQRTSQDRDHNPRVSQLSADGSRDTDQCRYNQYDEPSIRSCFVQ